MTCLLGPYLDYGSININQGGTSVLPITNNADPFSNNLFWF